MSGPPSWPRTPAGWSVRTVRLAGMGWRAQELDTRLIAARVAVHLGTSGPYAASCARRPHARGAAPSCGSGAPQPVLLPACQSGAGAVLAGDEVMGLTSALFTLGARTAVATVVPVPDEATRPLMLRLHDRIRGGLPVARTLAEAQAATDRDDPAAPATAGGFVCYGGG